MWSGKKDYDSVVRLWRKYALAFASVYVIDLACTMVLYASINSWHVRLMNDPFGALQDFQHDVLDVLMVFAVRFVLIPPLTEPLLQVPSPPETENVSLAATESLVREQDVQREMVRDIYLAAAFVLSSGLQAINLNALDSESEALVQLALDELLGSENRTVVLVAHRLSTVVDAHKIAVLDGGVVVEEGTHEMLLKLGASSDEGDGGSQLTKPMAACITLEEVRFCYQMRRDHEVLKGISLNIAAGTTCALVGRSGGGKSTLIHLLLRYYDPSSGRILIDGTDLTSLELASVHRQMGLVAQETQGDLTSRLSYDSNAMVAPCQTMLSSTLQNLLALVGGLFMCFWTSWKLSMLAFTTILPITYITARYAKWSSQLNRQIFTALGEANTVKRVIESGFIAKVERVIESGFITEVKRVIESGFITEVKRVIESGFITGVKRVIELGFIAEGSIMDRVVPPVDRSGFYDDMTASLIISAVTGFFGALRGLCFQVVFVGIKCIEFEFDPDLQTLQAVMMGSAVLWINLEMAMLSLIVGTLTTKSGIMRPELHPHELNYDDKAVAGHSCDLCRRRINAAYRSVPRLGSCVALPLHWTGATLLEAHEGLSSSGAATCRCLVCDFDCCERCFNRKDRRGGEGGLRGDKGMRQEKDTPPTEYFLRALRLARPGTESGFIAKVERVIEWGFIAKVKRVIESGFITKVKRVIESGFIAKVER
eukprot:gene17714-21104_t